MRYLSIFRFLDISAFLRRMYGKSVVLFGIMILALCLASSVTAQISIVKIVANNRDASPPHDITCSRGGSRPAVVAKMALQDGDKLQSKGNTKTVVVNCGGALYTLTAPFQVTFKMQGSVCYTGYGGSSGQLSVKSNNTPTNTKSGRGRILTHHTQYAIKLTPGKRTGLSRVLPFLFSRPVTREWIVFEDEGEVKTSGFSRTITQGEKLITGDGVPESKPITTEDIQRTAEPYARVDVSQARALPDDERDAEVPKLLALHAEVLADPKNPQKLEALKNEQDRIVVEPLTPPVTPPVKPGETAPVKPGETAPVKPGETAPVKPGETAPVKPGETAPVKPGETAPVKPGETPPVKPPETPRSLDAEQARLIDLISQGKYREAIAGFERRVRGPHATSLDSYELAVAYDRLLDQEVVRQSQRTPARHPLSARPPLRHRRKTLTKRHRRRRVNAVVPRRKRPAFYAKKALKLNETDRRLSQEEQDDSRRIASRRGK